MKMNNFWAVTAFAGKIKFDIAIFCILDLVFYLGCDFVRVFKSINNNIVSAFDTEGREVVVIGKGIGYKAKEGMPIDDSKITKVFVMSSKDNLDKLKNLLVHLKKDYIEITDEILSFAKQELGKKINENAYFTLADHISFAVTRMKEGMRFQNILKSEVRRFYPEEYKVGMFAIRLMKEKLGVDMPSDEAASIAMHILSAQYDISFSEGYRATQMLGSITEALGKCMPGQLDSECCYSERFITHLKYLVQRIMHKESNHNADSWLFDIMEKEYPCEIIYAKEVGVHIKELFQYEMPEHEIGYMAMHIKRVGIKHA